jgi:hypothetical protein
MSNRTNKPTIGALSFALRHKELWPADFHWDYSRCETCAMGLARRMWPKHVEEANLSSMINAFGIDADTAQRVFTGSYSYYRVGAIAGYEPVQPEHVADALDALA